MFIDSLIILFCLGYAPACFIQNFKFLNPPSKNFTVISDIVVLIVTRYIIKRHNVINFLFITDVSIFLNF